MLTLKQPIQLNSCQPFLTVSDAFHEKLAGNYSLLTAHISPKELLFLLTTPPELPELSGGMTTLITQNQVEENSSLTLEVLNQVVNRILVADQPSFTYQDQVYITSVLHKLGITDIQQFMTQVHQLREEHQSIQTLLALYRRERSQLQQQALSEPAPAGTQEQTGETVPESRPAARYYLHHTLYQRLGTREIYNTLNAYQRNLTALSPRALSASLQLSEQLRVSRQLSLSDLRQQTVHNTPLTLYQHVNRYELGDLLPPPATEEQVLSQAAEAALLSSVDHALVQLLERPAVSSFWLTLEEGLRQSVENTISRFTIYHGEPVTRTQSSTDYHSLLLALYQEEAALLQHFQQTRTALSIPPTASPSFSAGETSPPPPLTLTYGVPPEEEAADQVQPPSSDSPQEPGPTAQEIAALTRQLLTGGPAAPLPGPPHLPIEPPPSVLTLEHRYTQEQEPFLPKEPPSVSPPVETEASIHTITEQTQQLLIRQSTGASPSDTKRPPQAAPIPGLVERSLSQVKLEQTRQETLNSLRELAGLQRDLVLLEQTPSTIEFLSQSSIQETPGQEKPGTSQILRTEQHTEAQIERDAPSGGVLQGLPSTPAPQKAPSAPAAVPQIHRKGDTAPSEEADQTAPSPTASQMAAQLIRRERERLLSALHTVQTRREAGPEPSRAPAQSSSGGEPPTVPRILAQPAPSEEESRTVVYTEHQETARLERREHHTQHQTTQERQTIAPGSPPPAARQDGDAADVLRVLETLTEGHGGPSSGSLLPPGGGEDAGPIPQVLAQPPQTAEEAQFLLAQQVTELHQKNQAIYQQLQAEKAAQPAPPPPQPPDRGKLMSDALRALDAPEQVIRELLEQPGPDKKKAPPELELLLNHTDEHTRRLYESILLYESDPSAAIAQGLVSPASLGALNQEGRASPAQTALVQQRLDHVQQEVQRDLTHTEHLLERFQESPAGPGPVSSAEGPPRAPVQFVHKQAAEWINEELLTQLDRQRSTTVQQETTAQTIHRQEREQVEINRAAQQLVTQTSEDITALINRTLAKQMGTISDKVYRQMEKRLQTERYRRGRF